MHTQRPKEKERRRLPSKLRLSQETKPPADKPGVLLCTTIDTEGPIRCDYCVSEIKNIHSDATVSSAAGLFCKVRCRTLYHADLEGGFGRIVVKRRTGVQKIDAGAAVRLIKMKSTGEFTLRQMGKAAGVSHVAVRKFFLRSTA